MGFFRRRSAASAPQKVESQRDAVFEQLAAPDADWIRETARRVLAENGVEAVLDADGATFTASDGYRITLDNVVTTCARLPREEWLPYITAHYGSAARSAALPKIDDLTAEQLRTQVRTRVLPTDSLEIGGIDLSGYARPVADGLWAVLCVDFPETVSYVSSATAAAFPDLDGLFRSGQANTDAEPIATVEHIDGGLVGVTGDSLFIGSKVLNMAALLARTVDRDAPNGAVFVVPERSSVLFHVIDDLDAVTAIGTLATVGASMYVESTYAVSPNVFHWYRDFITCIGGMNDDHSGVTIRPSVELTEILNRLAE
ncbi:hypothetical protein [Gordonia humi]|uniref:Uncharacterized protein n=1 Tax=Gordonia humi TaxID=686429 RepID=A0A840EV66_9ACTN|nr:hypothetical protein [Gordonia humi]MBB4133736.1 hypothetical protein [Gordonia humi]